MHPPTRSSAPAAAAHSGGVPIVFERLLGTDAAERDELPLTYGLAHSRTRYNRLDVELATCLPPRATSNLTWTAACPRIVSSSDGCGVN